MISLCVSAVASIIAIYLLVKIYKPLPPEAAVMQKIATINTVNQVVVEVMYTSYKSKVCFILVQVTPQDIGRAFSAMECMDE